MFSQAPDQATEKKKSNKNALFHWVQNTIGLSPTQSGPICTAEQCFIRPPHVEVSSASQSSFAYVSSLHEELSDNHDNASLADILPPDYYEALKQAAKLGFLYSFISSTPVELFNQYFKARNFSANQIYYANMTIRMLSIIAFSAYMGFLDNRSLLLAIGMPVASIGLKLVGVNETISQLLPAGVIVAAQLLLDMMNAPKTLLSIATAACTGWIGNKAARTGYHLASNSLFTIAKHAGTVLEPVKNKL